MQIKYKVYKLSDENKRTNWFSRLIHKFYYRNHTKIKFVKSVYNDIPTHILVVNDQMFKVGVGDEICTNVELNAYRYLLHQFNIVLEEKVVFEEHTTHKITEFN